MRGFSILRDAFDYSFSEIATLLGKTEAACLQLVSRARQDLTAMPRTLLSLAPRHRISLDARKERTDEDPVRRGRCQDCRLHSRRPFGARPFRRPCDGWKGALSYCLYNDCDLAILDRMLPGMDGLSVPKALRASNKASPVLFLTALGQVDDRVEGLAAGSDDYLTKPFHFSELLARIDAIIRCKTEAKVTSTSACTT